MKNLIKFILIILCFSITLSCGYKVVNKLNKNNYTIAEIATSGAPRISYTIKNRLIFNSSKESNNVLTLNINVDKKRIVKNKNIKNEITDYEIVISTEVKYSLLGKTKENRFILNNSGSYKVSDQRINTINNEKKLLETLTNNIIDEISFRLNKEINDN